MRFAHSPLVALTEISLRVLAAVIERLAAMGSWFVS
jgi:hypothetical protein